MHRRRLLRSPPTLSTMRMRRRRATLVLVLLVTSFLALVAPLAGAGSTTGARVRPFSEVQASDLQFERDRSDPTRGIFRVETTEPMICAIVWGTDKSFGRFNNSLAMNGTGITDHDVILPDAKPGVRYSYVVQGTTADGTLYRSEVGTFRLRAGSTVGSPKSSRVCATLALGATVTEVAPSSRGLSAGERHRRRHRDQWATKGDGDRGSITLDLGAAHRDRVRRLRHALHGRRHGHHLAVHGHRRRRAAARVVPGRHGGPAPPDRDRLDRQVLRFDVARSTGGNVGAVEIRVYTRS